jgi:hypothetical protein
MFSAARDRSDGEIGIGARPSGMAERSESNVPSEAKRSLKLN